MSANSAETFAMPLFPIPADPKPTRAELAAEIRRWRGRISDKILMEWARFQWDCDQRKERPDDFTWPFSTWLLASDPTFNYDEYLKSDIWQQQRERVLTAAHHICAGCLGRATQIHHRDYRPRVLRGEDDSPLVAMCRRCHDAIHTGAPSWQEIERRLAEIVTFKDANAAKRNGVSIRQTTAISSFTSQGDDVSYWNQRNRERQREYRRLKKLGGGDIVKGRALEAEQRRSQMSPYDLGVEDASSRLAALRIYNVRTPDSCPFAQGSSEEAEYDRGWRDTMQKARN
jgi:hypothetical protein